MECAFCGRMSEGVFDCWVSDSLWSQSHLSLGVSLCAFSRGLGHATPHNIDSGCRTHWPPSFDLPRLAPLIIASSKTILHCRGKSDKAAGSSLARSRISRFETSEI